jgi:MFS family permease
MMMLNEASFLPTFCADKKWANGYKVNEFFVSLILSIFSLAQILFAPFSSSIKNCIGSKNTVVLGFSLMTLSTFGLGLASYFSDATLFIYFGVLLRFL